MGAIQLGQDDKNVMRAAASIIVTYLLAVVIANVVYACQDRRTGLKFGDSSLAIWMESHVKALLWAFGIAMEGLLINVGIQSSFLSFFSIISCGGGFLVLAAMLLNNGLRVKQSCDWWFRAGTMTILTCMAVGMVVEYGLKFRKSEQ